MSDSLQPPAERGAPAPAAPTPADASVPPPRRTRATEPRPLFARRTRLSRVLALLCTAVPAVCVVIGAAGSLKEALQRRAAEAGRRAASTLTQQRRANDVLFIRGAPEGLAGALRAAFPNVLEGPTPALPTFLFGRAFVVGPRAGAPAMAGLGPSQGTFPVGPGAASLHETAGASLFGRLSAAEVATIAPPAAPPAGPAPPSAGAGARPLGETPCRRGGLRHACAIEPFVVVEPLTTIIGGQRFECIGAHPTPKAALVVRFPRAARGRVHVAGALADSAGEGLSPVHIEVSAGDGVPPARFDVAGKGRFSFAAVDTPSAVPARDVVVRLTVDAPGSHHFCFLAGVQ